MKKICKFAMFTVATVTGFYPMAMRSQGFLWNAPSANAAALGGTYVPSQTGVMDTLATNPAGLREMQHPVLNAAVSGVFARGNFSNRVNTNVSMKTAPAAIPFGAFAMPLGKSRWSVGIAELPVLLGDADWTYQDAPGTAGASYGLQRNRSKIIVLRSVAGAAVTINPRLQLGATVGLDYNQNTLIAPYIFQTQPVVKGLKTLLNLHTDGFGWNGSVGVLVRPVSRLQLGVAYRSRTRVESTGTATGNLGAQLVAAGLAGARPDFTYQAKVENTFPQSVTVHEAWTVRPGWTVVGQVQWVNWKNAFRTLKTDLSSGNNADVNGLLGSTSLHDEMPLYWKDQYPARLGVEHTLTETVTARAGFAHVNSAMPTSTITPMTAVLFNNQLTAGGGWHHGRLTLDAAYAYTFNGNSYTAKSSLLAGEYDGSRIRTGMQAVTVSSAVVF